MREAPTLDLHDGVVPSSSEVDRWAAMMVLDASPPADALARRDPTPPSWRLRVLEPSTLESIVSDALTRVTSEVAACGARGPAEPEFGEWSAGEVAAILEPPEEHRRRPPHFSVILTDDDAEIIEAVEEEPPRRSHFRELRPQRSTPPPLPKVAPRRPPSAPTPPRPAVRAAPQPPVQTVTALLPAARFDSSPPPDAGHRHKPVNAPVFPEDGPVTAAMVPEMPPPAPARRAGKRFRTQIAPLDSQAVRKAAVATERAEAGARSMVTLVVAVWSMAALLAALLAAYVHAA